MKIFTKNQWIWLAAILILASFLRFWKISEWQHLTYDQSRDYIIIKRILVDKKFTLVGPTASIAPGFFLPPFYYYSLVPFVKLSGFHINGPDIYTAILGVLSVFFFYFLAKDLFGVFPALISSFLFAINPYLVQSSRHALNPNTLFLYSILFFLSFEKYVFKKERRWFVLAGFSLGWAIGLHLTAVVFLPFFIYLIFLEIKNKLLDKITISGIILFLIVFSPLLLFDLRHNFPITKAAISYLNGSKNTAADGQFMNRIKEMAIDLYRMPTILLSGTFQKENLAIRPINMTVINILSTFSLKNSTEGTKIILSLFLWLIAFFYLIFSRGEEKRILIAFLFFGLLIRLCFPENSFYFYYYLSVFPLVFLILAFLIKKTETKLLVVAPIVISLLFLAGFSWFSLGFIMIQRQRHFFYQ